VRTLGRIAVVILAAAVVAASPSGSSAAATAGASLGRSCPSPGDVATVRMAGRDVRLVCAGKGTAARWRRAREADGAGASLLVGRASAFAPMARAVKAQNARCMVVLERGRPVAEWRFFGHGPASREEVASVTKSFAGALVGIAQTKGLLQIDQPASTWITEWSGTASAGVTVRHLLAMTSGRTEMNVIAAPNDLRGAVLATSQNVRVPGARWSYHNASSQALEMVLSRATGESVVDFAQRELFDPLGMTASFTLDPYGVPGLYAGIQATCTDVAKLVQLYLDGGSWNGRRIVDAAYVADSLSPQVTGSGPNTQMNGAYGLQWWLNAAAPAVAGAGSPQFSAGPMYPALPTDVFWVSGACHQLGAGIPGTQQVVVVLRPGCRTAQDAQVAQSVTAPQTTFFAELATALDRQRR
jgi:CubicO group peptidase (beta-lactamase class C family)